MAASGQYQLLSLPPGERLETANCDRLNQQSKAVVQWFVIRTYLGTLDSRSFISKGSINSK